MTDFPKLEQTKKQLLIKLASPIISSKLVTPERFSSTYPDTSNIVLSQASIPVPKVLLKDVEEEIEQRFNVEVSFGLLAFKPQVIPSFFPPHNDGGRNLALNYILKNGGESVSTRFYKRPYAYTRNDRQYWHEQSLEFESEHICLEDEWYAFDSQIPHAAFNITDVRLILMCLLSRNGESVTYSEFKNNYLI